MKQRTDFRSYAVITLADGTELAVPESGFVIGGNRITDGAGEGTETTILEGAEGYVLELENPLWLGKETTGLALTGAAVIGQSLRKFEGEYIGYPIAEFMDTVDVVDRKGRHYRSVLTDIEFVFCGCTTLSCSAQSAVRNSSRYISAEAKALIEARRLVLQEKTARETAVSNLAERLTAAGGLYSTAQKQEDGSTIYYLHDKPSLAESRSIMKLTADVIGLSTDGGASYPFGFAITGEAIMGIIQAEGVNTEWLKSGVSTMDQIEGLANEFEVTREGLRSEVRQSTGALQESLEAKLSVQDETIAANRDYVEQTAAELRQTSTQLVQTSESLSLKVTEIVNNGVSELHNEMGYDVDGTGFHVSREGDEISATLNNHGLTVKHNDEKQLVADETGVDARHGGRGGGDDDHIAFDGRAGGVVRGDPGGQKRRVYAHVHHLFRRHADRRCENGGLHGDGLGGAVRAERERHDRRY